VGFLGQSNLTRLHDDEFCASSSYGATNHIGDDGMTLAGVASGDENAVRFSYVFNGVGHGTTSKSRGQTGHRR
jgi:hypothetical protein